MREPQLETQFLHNFPALHLIHLMPRFNYFWLLVLVFDEDFVFEVRAAELQRRTLEVILYDFDAYARHYRMGVLRLHIGELDLCEKIKIWRNLTPMTDVDEKVMQFQS